MSGSSRASLNRARWAAAREEERRIQKDYKIMVALPNWVQFRFGGVIVEFRRDKASPFRIYRTGYTIPQLGAEDYAFLFTKAEELMVAVERGYKEIAREKAARQDTELVIIESDEPKPPALFTPSQLPVHLNPRIRVKKRRK